MFFRSFKQTIQILQQINVKNVHPVSSTRIRTHNIVIMSLLLQPLEQGSHLSFEIFCSITGILKPAQWRGHVYSTFCD